MKKIILILFVGFAAAFNAKAQAPMADFGNQPVKENKNFHHFFPENFHKIESLS